jgi:hypothetical protein
MPDGSDPPFGSVSAKQVRFSSAHHRQQVAALLLGRTVEQHRAEVGGEHGLRAKAGHVATRQFLEHQAGADVPDAAAADRRGQVEGPEPQRHGAGLQSVAQRIRDVRLVGVLRLQRHQLVLHEPPHRVAQHQQFVVEREVHAASPWVTQALDRVGRQPRL